LSRESRDRSMSLSKRSPGRTPSLNFFLAGTALAFCLIGASPAVRQEIRDNEGFLVGVLLKNFALKERMASDIPASDRELQTSERIFLEAENRMTIATETHNTQAAWDAREPLKKARSDLNKLKLARARLDQALGRAEATSVAARSMILSGKGADIPISGLASLHSGKAKILLKNGNEVNLAEGRPRFLELGEEIITMGSSLAEVQVLNGRATVLLGERSRLKLEEDGRQDQALRLVQGKIYSIIDRRDEFAGLFEEGRVGLMDGQKLGEAVAGARERAQALADKTLTLRTPIACLSAAAARLTLELLKSGASEISVLDGTVDAGDAECSRRIPIEKGFRVAVSKEGIIEPKKAADVERWWEK